MAIHRIQRLSPYHVMERLAQLPTRVLFGMWLFMVLGFALAYFHLSSLSAAKHGVVSLVDIESVWERFGNALYFSIVTATTLGYGDLVPMGFSKALAASESILGFFLFAVVISKLVSHKHEIALYNVHKLSFQNAFFTTREGFFIIRRDCDEIAAEAEAESSPLSERAWSNLYIVFQKGQALMESVLDFYDDFDWYTIDTRHEKLLLESVHRTLHRVHALIRSLPPHTFSNSEHRETTAELGNFVALCRKVLHRWQKISPHGHEEWFRKIAEVIEELAETVTRS